MIKKNSILDFFAVPDFSLTRSSTISRSSLGVVIADDQDQQWLDVTTIKVIQNVFLEILILEFDDN